MTENKSSVLKRCFRGLFGLLLVYWVYVFPIDMIISWVTGTPVPRAYIVASSALLFVLISLFMRAKKARFPVLLRALVYEGMGVGFFAWMIINLLLLIKLIFPISDPDCLAAVAILVPLLSLYSYWQAKKIHLKQIRYESSKLKQPQKIAFISDVHLGSNGSEKLHKIVALLRPLKMDMLLIGGDLVDSRHADLSVLKCLQTLAVPIYFVTGNHEHYLNETEQLLVQLNEDGIQVLDNQSVQVNGLNIIGISDPVSNKKKVALVSQLAQKRALNITLVHKPSIWDAINTQTDLMLSGHTHNGQMFPFKYLVRRQFPYCYGEYWAKTAMLYVSSGAGTWGPRMRLGTKNEALILDLVPSP